MVDVKSFLREAGGSWLRADYVQIGDLLEIMDEGRIDSETFQKPYLIIKVRLQRTGEQYLFRMGYKNVLRVSQVLGTDTKAWIGNYMEVIAIEQYPGLARKGILVRGLRKEDVKAKPKLAEISEETMKALEVHRPVIEMEEPLTISEFMALPAQVRAEMKKLGLVEEMEDGSLIKFTEKARKLLEG